MLASTGQPVKWLLLLLDEAYCSSFLSLRHNRNVLDSLEWSVCFQPSVLVIFQFQFLFYFLFLTTGDRLCSCNDAWSISVLYLRSHTFPVLLWSLETPLVSSQWSAWNVWPGHTTDALYIDGCCRRMISSLLFMVALSNRADHFHPVVSFFFYLFYSSPNLSRRRLDDCHTSTHGVVLVRI